MAAPRARAPGWYRWTNDGAEMWGHDGGDIGVATNASMRRSDSVGFVVLRNGEGTTDGTSWSLSRALLEAGTDL